MPQVSTSTLYVGTKSVTRVYRGDGTQVWPAPAKGAVNVSNLWKSPQDVDGYVAANPSLSLIADKPHAKWVGDWVSTNTVTATVAGYANSAAAKTMVVCLYAIPGRDLGGYSAGGFPDRASYLSWVKAACDGVGVAPAILIYEPDALGHVDGMSDTAKAERIETMRQASLLISAPANVETYIDCAMWLAPARAAELLISVGIANMTGIAINVSAFNDQSTCFTFGENVLTELANRGVAGKKYVIDTSRNGNGPLTAAFGAVGKPWLDAGQAWCNPPGRGLGVAPGPIADHLNCRAALWIKNPGGSDGDSPRLAAASGKFVSNYYGKDAPIAGTYWLESALDYVAHTGGSGTGTTGTATPLSQITDQFTSTALSLWPRSFGTYSAPNGRARFVCTADYSGIDSSATYTLVGSSAYATLYPPTAGGGATAAYIEMAVESATAGTRMRCRIDVIANTIAFAVDTSYNDPTLVTTAYVAAQMARVRFREAGGNVYWETSANGATWVTRRTAATPAWMKTDLSSLAFSAHRDGGVNDYAEVDDVNVGATA